MENIVMKDIPGYNGAYAVTRDGRIWSNKRKQFMKLSLNKRGYCVVSLNIGSAKKEYRVHRLVALAFIPNPENKPTVDHINRNKLDNRAENLRWSTYKEQNLNREPGTISRAMRVLASELSKSVEMRAADNHSVLLATFDSMSDASVFVTGSRAGRKNIGACVNGRRESAYGYYWCLAPASTEVESDAN